MKILVTGTNNYHAVPNWHLATRSKYRLVTAATGLVAALRDMGHEVDQRFVIPGEDLSAYDKIFTVYFDVTGGQQGGGYGLFWTLSQRKDAIIVIDDWATPTRVSKHYEKNYTDEELDKVLFREYLVGSQRAEARFAAEDPELRKALKAGFAENVFETRKILYCAFDKFNVSKIFDKPHVSYSFNPEAYVPSPTDRLVEMNLLEVNPLAAMMGDTEETVDKTRRWVIAGIGGLPTKKACKLKDTFTWEVEIFGRDTIDPDAKLGKEPEVIDAYRKARAVYYPDQNNFGSNWWRNRPRQCADMGAVLFMTSNEEAELFGPSYMNLSIEKIEAMTDAELDDLAARQKEDYYKSNPLDKDAVKRKLNEIMA